MIKTILKQFQCNILQKLNVLLQLPTSSNILCWLIKSTGTFNNRIICINLIPLEFIPYKCSHAATGSIWIDFINLNLTALFDSISTACMCIQECNQLLTHLWYELTMHTVNVVCFSRRSEMQGIWGPVHIYKKIQDTSKRELRLYGLSSVISIIQAGGAGGMRQGVLKC